MDEGTEGVSYTFGTHQPVDIPPGDSPGDCREIGTAPRSRSLDGGPYYDQFHQLQKVPKMVVSFSFIELWLLLCSRGLYSE